jgi:hypothetical protein
MQEEQKEQQTVIDPWLGWGLIGVIIIILAISSYSDQRVTEKEIIGAVSAGFAKASPSPHNNLVEVNRNEFEATSMNEAFNKGKAIGFAEGEKYARKEIIGLMRENHFIKKLIDLGLEMLMAHGIDNETQGQKISDKTLENGDLEIENSNELAEEAK